MSLSRAPGALFVAVFISGCQTWTQSDPGSMPATESGSEPGVVNVFYWDGVAGTSLSDLTSLSTFPSDPDEIVKISSLTSPANRGDNYGALAKGFIEPPLDGLYQFFISSDDASEFRLSSSQMAADAETLASVPRWTYPQQFDKYTSQKSGYINLEAGKRYYFEILLKEGSGSDHFTVAWEGPGFSRSIVPGEAIYSWAPPAEIVGDTSAQEAYHLGYRVGFLDGNENIQFNPEYPPLDSDGDGIYDNWEVVHGLNPDASDDAISDPDGDLLSASEEFLLGTAEGNADTDGDGIPDGAEFALELDPLNSNDALQDLDGDGFTNLEEYIAGTNIRSVTDTPGESDLSYVAGFVGQYFTGMDFDALAYVRTDSEIDFSWSRYGDGPEGLPEDQFSIRWFSEFLPAHGTGARDYQFTVRSDDGARLFINDNVVIDEWQVQAATTFNHVESLPAGETVHLTLEYYEDAQDAVIELTVTDLSNGNMIGTAESFRVPDPTTSSSVDSDGDGIPDTWELANGTKAWIADGVEVLNSQGVTNLEAYQGGLVPRTLESTEGATGTEQSAGEEDASTADGTASLSWTAPSTREDGEAIALSEIQSYIVRYGREAGALNQQVEISSGDTSYQFSNLESGTWFFSVQVVDTNGLVSKPSATVEYNVP